MYHHLHFALYIQDPEPEKVQKSCCKSLFVPAQRKTVNFVIVQKYDFYY